MKLSVIIVNYNVKHFLEQCLHSVLQAIDSIESEVMVIDNNSTDGSLEYLQPIFPSVRFIKSSENLGFGRANNLGLQSAKGEFILFLNPDTLVTEDCFVKCVRFLESQPKAGALGIRMLDGTGKFLPESKRSFPNTATAFYKLTGLSALFPKSSVFNKYALGHLDEHQNHKVDVLAGAFMMFKQSVLEQIGGFDEAFFMYGEDIDLSYRSKQAGFENWYFSESSIIHFKGESAKQGSLNYVKMFYQAMIIFVNKHYQGKGSGIFRLFLNTGIAVRALISGFSLTVTINRKDDHTFNRRKVIVGTLSEYNECKQNFHQHLNKTTLPGRVAIDSNDQQDSLGSIHQLKEICDQHNVREIIFIYGTLSLGKIIDLIQQMGNKYCYSFHYSGSDSIVGSSSKNSIGKVYAKAEASFI